VCVYIADPGSINQTALNPKPYQSDSCRVLVIPLPEIVTAEFFENDPVSTLSGLDLVYSADACVSENAGCEIILDQISANYPAVGRFEHPETKPPRTSRSVVDRRLLE
jgi:hypothetical protein